MQSKFWPRGGQVRDPNSTSARIAIVFQNELASSSVRQGKHPRVSICFNYDPVLFAADERVGPTHFNIRVVRAN